MGKKKPRKTRPLGKLCPDPRICPSCTDNASCQYLQKLQHSQFLDGLLKILRRRVTIGGGECLVTIRNISRILTKTINFRPQQLTKMIDEVLRTIRAVQWGNAASEYRTEKWNVRPISSKIYQMDQVTIEKLEWFIDRSSNSRRDA